MQTGARLAGAGGQQPPDDPPTWLVLPDIGLFVVASPFGSSAVAATLTLDAIPTALGRPSTTYSSLEPPACARLRGAILGAGDTWSAVAAERSEYRGIGATLAAVLVVPGSAAVAHLGDCRVALIRNDAIVLRTVDHVQRVRDGRRIVERLVGAGGNPEVHSWTTALGDLFLLTAGVHDVLSDDDTVRCVAQTELPTAAAALVELAKRRGGTDHLTAVVARIDTAGTG